jgi:hypothetical protein
MPNDSASLTDAAEQEPRAFARRNLGADAGARIMDDHHGRATLVTRGAFFLLVVGCLSQGAQGASFRTPNFVVEAATPDAARAVAERAEVCRKMIARQWLGKELPNWSSPCPIKVKLTTGEAGGVTSFGFARGKVTDQEMSVEGRLERILACAVPHEVTHTVFAAFFGAPMPRWADEGASLLSEDLRERKRHDQITLDLFSRRGDMPLGRLFRVEDYPKDLMGFYGQGYSISRFLVEMGGRPRFLLFVRDGLKSDWDAATKTHYGLSDTRELDRAWRAWHKVVAMRGSTSENLVVARARAEE